MFVQTPGNSFLKVLPRPGINIIAETKAPSIKKKAYARRVEVEFFILGHALQHKLHAAEPQQHVTLDNKLPMAQPIISKFMNNFFFILGI